MSREIKICLVGAGRHARGNIYPSLYRLANTKIVATCDLNAEAVQSVAAQHRIPKAYTNVQEMLREERPDAAIVCTGPAGHAAVAVEVMEAGVDVYTEKPTAPSLTDALRMLETQQRTGRICMTAYKKRFAPAYVKTKQLIESPQFGQRAALNIVRSSGSGAIPAEQMRGHMLDWTCHTLDLGVFLWGKVHTVTTTAVNRDGKYAWSVAMQHEGGAISHQVFTNCPSHPEEAVYICGSGSVVIHVENSIDMTATLKGKPFDGHSPSFTTGSDHSDIQQGFAGELIEFVNAVRDKREPEANIRQACHTIAIFEAMWTSAQDGKPVKVEFQQ
ncbi:MAG TPA: Gfo/Idh/MocA family oxidoreductase [Tepidisphaeraceae bacterium]|jgi:predicted dehydrogenase|nr:Gfo/Idh/MocA family oxidoreductase [Tepidisphaeraceae bacterium]